MATQIIESQPVPLDQDETGAIRVGKTRVLLELVIEAYVDGATPETIVQWFESLRLADVYTVISYYLNHEEEVKEYLRQRDELAAEDVGAEQAIGFAHPLKNGAPGRRNIQVIVQRRGKPLQGRGVRGRGGVASGLAQPGQTSVQARQRLARSVQTFQGEVGRLAVVRIQQQVTDFPACKTLGEQIAQREKVAE